MSVALIELVEMTATLNVVVSTGSTTVCMGNHRLQWQPSLASCCNWNFFLRKICVGEWKAEPERRVAERNEVKRSNER